MVNSNAHGGKPGKWEIDGSSLGVNTWIHTEANKDHGHIKVARIYHGGKTDKEIEDQAFLIMNAPETLYKFEEVMKVLKTIPDYTKDQDIVNIINQAIKDFGW